MAKKSKYKTLSIPRGVAELIEELIEKLGLWPSVSAFAREACIKMIREEWPRLKTEEEPPIEEDPMKGRKRRD